VERKQKLRERASKFLKDLVPNWRPSREQKLWTIRITLVLVVFLGIFTLVGLPFGITLWDWVKLLIVPTALALGGYLLNRSENQRRDANAKQREKIDRDIADQRQKEEVLQTYLNQMGQLLLDEGLSQSNEDKPEVRTVARARTLAALTALDPLRKRRVLQFLYEAKLIDAKKPIMDLSGADLSHANLEYANLKCASLEGMKLLATNLKHAHLEGAKLSRINSDIRTDDASHLKGTHLEKEFLTSPTTKRYIPPAPILKWAKLKSAYLSESNLSGAELWWADLTGAVLVDANLLWADLTGADLTGADLSKANLSGAELIQANLDSADLSEADLSEANLSYASGVTNEQLSAASSLEGATMPDEQTLRGDNMPNGPTFEDWLKDKEGRGEDG
jgi:uncharacterized protein YjbI with pentapeptide repeats